MSNRLFMRLSRPARVPAIAMIVFLPARLGVV